MGFLGSIGDSIFGKSGTSAPIANSTDYGTNGALHTLTDVTNNMSDANLQSQLADVRSGKLSFSDFMKNAQAYGSANNSSPYTMAAINSLATDPVLGSQLAQNQVANGAVTGALYGQGGLQDQAIGQYGALNNNLADDRNSLMGRDQSYGLTDTDLAAYGQAAGNITRQYGQNSQNLAQNLADRGLAAAPSGVAVQGFSDLLGNQNEQLANAQLQIAQNRITTAQGLAQARTNADLSAIGSNNSLLGSLGSSANTAINNQYNQQLEGAQNQYNTLAGAAGLGMNNQSLQQNALNSQFSQNQNSATTGLAGQAASGFIGGLTGGAGTSLGASMAGGGRVATDGTALPSTASGGNTSGAISLLSKLPALA